MTRIREIIDQMKDTIDDNLDDPNSARARENKKWTYTHFPQYGKNADLPRIGFHKISAGYSPKGINHGAETFTEADIQASVFVRRGKKFDFDNDGNNEPEEDLADYLTEKIKTIIEDNQSDFTALGDDVEYVIPRTTDTVKPEGQNFILESITFEANIWS